jgi:hypothetical protein
MYRKLKFDQFFRRKVRQLLLGRFKINESGKLAPYSPRGIVDTPWVFTNFDARRKFCTLWNAIYCNEFHIIPKFCRFHCWKTVIYPRNVYELFQLADLLRALNLPSKCGIDKRNYTYAAWDGFVYGDDLEQGKQYYRQTREAVDRVISPDIKVILKRGCTEMERMKPSDQWDDYPPDEEMLEFQLDDIFHFEELDFHQSAWEVRDIKENWILRAIEICDPTVEQTLEEYSHGVTLQDLTVSAVTYHDKETKKDVKHDKTNRQVPSNKRARR